MLVMGIESSCDETACAIVNDKREILSSVVWSQFEEHRRFGGVVPEIAARAHLEQVDLIVQEAMTEAQVDFDDLSAVAVAGGPGLIGGVIVGVMTAKAIAMAHNLPFVAVNHLEGHALMARLTNDVAFPYLLLLVSGGHCQILAVEAAGRLMIRPEKLLIKSQKCYKSAIPAARISNALPFTGIRNDLLCRVR